MRRIKALSQLLALGLTAFGLFRAQEALALNIKLTSDPNPPQNGLNTVVVALNDDIGNPIEGAKLQWKTYMPAMGAMPYMEEFGEVTKEDSGQYTVEYWLSMAGSWEITLAVDLNGDKSEHYYALTTSIPGFKDKNHSPQSSSANASHHLEIGVRRMQQIGVRFAEVKTRSLARDVHAIGILEADDKRRAEIVPRYDGYIEELPVARVGERVEQGQALAVVYSPALVAAQNEYLIALRSRGQSVLLESTREKLRNLGMATSDIARVERSGKALERVTLRSPIAGTVIQVGVSKGSSFKSGQVLHTLSDLSENYFVARVFQQDLPLVRVGQKAFIEFTGGEKVYEGVVDLIYPSVEQGTGTTNVRIRTEEKSARFKPGLYATIRMPIAFGDVLSVPSEAVLYSGMNRYVFVDKGQGRLEAREVFLGRQSGEFAEVLRGIQDGERVVASGNFLLSSEAQLRSALPKWSLSDDTEEAPRNMPEGDQAP